MTRISVAVVESTLAHRVQSHDISHFSGTSSSELSSSICLKERSQAGQRPARRVVREIEVVLHGQLEEFHVSNVEDPDIDGIERGGFVTKGRLLSGKNES